MALFTNNWDKYLNNNGPPHFEPLPCPQTESTITDVLEQIPKNSTDPDAKAIRDGYDAKTASLARGIHPNGDWREIAKVTAENAAQCRTLHISIYPKAGALVQHVYVLGPNTQGKYTFKKVSRTHTSI
jgi:hypothetical protein